MLLPFSFGILQCLVRSLTMVGVCRKIANVIVKRKDILRLLNILNTYPCCYRNEQEKLIQDKIDTTINAIVICVTVYRLSHIGVNHPKLIPTSCDVAMAVYQSDWYILSLGTQKSLLLVKLSYSLYNVLQ
ncbi:Protein of unknown function [Cotesia congregata]|uniref:Uncharacterized protein n=1 Tax=Cotesia congregata TaxID=51543 RepID=A0A8J2MYU5_COTCN|nr:Protein of unknown function [Cotesia congregata]